MTADGNWRCAASLAMLMAAAGCSTANLEDLAPASASPTASADTAPSLSRPGDYPNLNVIPVPAAEQITPERRETDAAALRARRDQLAGGGNVADRSDELRRIARTHGDEAIRTIEAE